MMTDKEYREHLRRINMLLEAEEKYSRWHPGDYVAAAVIVLFICLIGVATCL